MKKLSPLVILQIITVIMLLVALQNNPYGYYQILRWVVGGTFGYMAFMGYKQEQYISTWIYGITAVIFNPIATIHLDRDTWSILNILAIGVIIYTVSSNYYIIHKSKKN